MTTTMIEALREEIDFISGIIEYSDDQDLVELKSIDDAKVQSTEFINDYAPDIPGSLADPEVMMMAWNAAVREEKAIRRHRKIEQEDEENAKRFPESLRFKAAYEDGSSCFFDPDQLSHDLCRVGYDEVHREIITKALTAYMKK